MLKIYNLRTNETAAIINEKRAKIDLINKTVEGDGYKLADFNPASFQFSILGKDGKAQLKKTKDFFIFLVKQTAGELLSKSDWRITKQLETGCYSEKHFQKLKKMRAEVRKWSDDKEIAIKGAKTIKALNKINIFV